LTGLGITPVPVEPKYLAAKLNNWPYLNKKYKRGVVDKLE